MLDVLGTEYIKLARMKGLTERQVIWKHALKNAALPIVTFAALLFVSLLNGSIIVETVFGWPGLGLLIIEAVQYRDYPVVQTVVLCLSGMYITANLLVDVLYAYLNPRMWCTPLMAPAFACSGVKPWGSSGNLAPGSL